MPQFLLRNFVDEKDDLHVYDRRTPTRGVFSAPPFKVFFEKNLYSSISKDGKRDAALEIAFRPLEYSASKLIYTILASTRNGRLPALSTGERDLLDIFTYYQWKRVPDTINRVVSSDKLNALGAESIEEFERDVRPLTAAEKSSLEDPVTWKRIIQRARTDVIARGSPEVLGFFRKMALNVVRITNKKKAFVIGSHPVAKLHEPGQAHMADSQTQIWLPIASDVAIAYTGHRPARYIEIADAAEIRQVNIATAWGSSLIASRSPELTRSLIGDVGVKMEAIGVWTDT